MKEKEQTMADSAQFPDIFIRKMEEKFERRRKALEQLARLTVEISLPPVLRTFLLGAEIKRKMPQPEVVAMLLGRTTDAEDTKNILTAIQTLFPDRKSHDTMKTQMGTILASVRQNLKQMLCCQKGIQLETWRAWRLFTDMYIAKHLPPRGMENSMVFHVKLKGRPELSDSAFFRLSEADFTFDSAETARERFGNDAADLDVGHEYWNAEGE